LQFQAALELDPTNETAHYNLGALFADEGKLEAAARHLREAVRLQPADGAAHHRLADVLRAMGNPDEALEHYGQAITLNSANPLLRVRQASLLIALERYQEAATRLSEAYGFLPREPLVVNAYARFLAACPVESLRDGEEALELAAEMYELQPTVAHATTLAMALGEVGRCSEAAELQGKAVAVAQGAGQADLAAQLRETQTRYQSGPPCRYPTQP
jgi:tetratricopeptide (TPR) repeat protein